MIRDLLNWVRNTVTDALLWCIVILNQTKDSRLSHRLHDIADQYDPRPTGAWS